MTNLAARIRKLSRQTDPAAFFGGMDEGTFYAFLKGMNRGEWRRYYGADSRADRACMGRIAMAVIARAPRTLPQIPATPDDAEDDRLMGLIADEELEAAHVAFARGDDAEGARLLNAARDRVRSGERNDPCPA